MGRCMKEKSKCQDLALRLQSMKLGRKIHSDAKISSFHARPEKPNYPDARTIALAPTPNTYTTPRPRVDSASALFEEDG